MEETSIVFQCHTMALYALLYMGHVAAIETGLPTTIREIRIEILDFKSNLREEDRKSYVAIDIPNVLTIAIITTTQHSTDSAITHTNSMHEFRILYIWRLQCLSLSERSIDRTRYYLSIKLYLLLKELINGIDACFKWILLRKQLFNIDIGVIGSWAENIRIDKIDTTCICIQFGFIRECNEHKFKKSIITFVVSKINM